MIRLSRLNGQEVAINCDLIEWVEATPDTTVRMVSGHSLLVLEAVDEVIARIVSYRQEILANAGLAAVLTAGHRPASQRLEPPEGAEAAPEVSRAGVRLRDLGRHDS